MTTSNRPPRVPNSGLRPIDGLDLGGFEPEGYRESLFEGDAEWDDESEPGRGDLVRGWLWRRLTQGAWLVLAGGLALGSAGVAAAMQPVPDGTNRAELTWGADQQLTVRLDSATRDLVLLKDDVDQLGTITRQTLSSLAQVNSLALSAAWNGGAIALDSIETRAASLAESLECSPWDDARDVELGKLYRADLIDQWRGICVAIGSVAPLPSDWGALVSGSRTAMQVATDINTHDSVAADALQLATAGRYPDALKRLSEADAAIADATSIAATLAKLTDVSTLQNWLTRTAAMDRALQTLWEAMVTSKGRVTTQVTAALKGVNEAKALLPDDAAVMQVVLYELAGRLTVNGISIEAARGRLSAAIDNLTGGTVQGQ
jgi:hypothetical protein